MSARSHTTVSLSAESAATVWSVIEDSALPRGMTVTSARQGADKKQAGRHHCVTNRNRPCARGGARPLVRGIPASV